MLKDLESWEFAILLSSNGENHVLWVSGAF